MPSSVIDKIKEAEAKGEEMIRKASEKANEIKDKGTEVANGKREEIISLGQKEYDKHISSQKQLAETESVKIMDSYSQKIDEMRNKADSKMDVAIGTAAKHILS